MSKSIVCADCPRYEICNYVSDAIPTKKLKDLQEMGGEIAKHSDGGCRIIDGYPDKGGF